MPPILGNLIVIAVLGVTVGLIIRSLYRNHRSGSSCGCSGDCSCCGKCK